jgi:hypothetical protein
MKQIKKEWLNRIQDGLDVIEEIAAKKRLIQNRNPRPLGLDSLLVGTH